MMPFEDIKQLLDQGRYADARARAEALLASAAEEAELWHLLGIAEARMGREQRAREHFQRAIELKPDEPNYHLNLAVLLAERAPEAADIALRQAAKLDPNRASTHLARAELAARQGRWDDAESLYRTALRARADSIPALTGLIHALIARGRLDEALSQAQRAAQLHARSAPVQTAFGRALMAKGHLDFARQALDNALTLEPRYVPAALLAIELGLRRGELEFAERAVAAAEQAGADPGALALARVDLALRRGARGTAQQLLREAVGQRPDDARLLTAWVDLERRLGGKEAALVAAQAALQRTPTAASRHLTIACLLDLDRHAEALALARSWSEQQPEDLGAWLHRARLAELAFDFDGALAAAERALTLDPRAAVARLIVARGRIRAGRANEAIATLGDLLAEPLGEEQRAELLRLRGVAFHTLGDLRNALNAWRESAATAIYPSRIPDLPEVEGLRRPQVSAPPPTGPEGPERLAFLIGVPGSGVESLAWALGRQPGVAVLRDRFYAEPRADFLSGVSPVAPDRDWRDTDVELVRRRYLKQLRLHGHSAPIVVDWLPELDVRRFDVLRAAFPEALWIVLQREPRDALLAALYTVWPGMDHAAPERSAQAIQRQWQHLAAVLATHGTPHLSLSFEALLDEPERELERLRAALGAARPIPREDWQRALMDLGGLKRYLAPGRHEAYRALLGPAFDILVPSRPT